MTDKKEYADRFIREFTGKLFYFCLKKTGNIHEAEDLSADICLSVLTSLERGSEPENFPAWVWRVARNRYSVWADKKRIRAEHTADVDLTVLSRRTGARSISGLSIRGTVSSEAGARVHLRGLPRCRCRVLYRGQECP